MLECIFSTDSNRTKEMSSVCISNCVDDVSVPVRASYVNLYKWPESDAEFVSRCIRSSSSSSSSSSSNRSSSRMVVDGLSCRQMYLRSYKFTTKNESVPHKCFGRVKQRVRSKRSNINGGNTVGRTRKCCIIVLSKVKKKMVSCAALFSMLLSCTSLSSKELV